MVFGTFAIEVMSEMKKHVRCISCNSDNLRSKRGYERHALVHCGSCGLHFIEQIPTQEELTAFYAKYAYSKDPWISPITIKRYHTLLDEFEPYRKTNKLLDVGCGAGHFLNVAKERGWEVHGTEYSPAAIALCEAKGIEMKSGALNPADFDLSSFDVITSFEVLEHINNPQEDTGSIEKLLRPGGMHYLTTPNFNALSRFWLKADYNVIGYPEHLAYYSRASLKKLMKSFDLSTKRCVTEGISISRIRKSKGDATFKLNSEAAPDENLRAKTETNPFWKGVKRLANTVFRVTGTGVTLKGYFVKPTKASK